MPETQKTWYNISMLIVTQAIDTKLNYSDTCT